ncbi:AraC family transcriptional regulator [Burkholderia sp. WAC0059]|uniref:AraC family transcriptional regulator n=1 Tax=Burkholderia sp. WAC0059 TaxID=2066022 RepID=UPI000C7EDF9F|nr:AraC family transcriptional regulator [Burkholderia sp. WAC0059]PLZ01780.1 AraC family transcriptional regulator [Burkholderia sp. WAC0059]
MDVLSETLSMLHPRSTLSAGLQGGGEWGLRFPAHEGVKFNAVIRGACWLLVDGVASPVRLEAGDCFLLTKGRSFVLTTNLNLEPVDSQPAYDRAVDGIARCNAGDDFFLIGGRFTFEDSGILPFTDTLPPVVHVQCNTEQASVLRWALLQLASELKLGYPGGALMAKNLAHMMFVQILRLFLNGLEQRGVGWLYAVTDSKLRAVISAIQRLPAHRWTVPELSSVAGMSRSVFAQRFKEVVGVSPIEYVTRWRMLIAVERLRNSRQTIATIAFSLGYESESAFSSAFKRVMDCSPKHFQKRTSTSLGRSSPPRSGVPETNSSAESRHWDERSEIP